MDDKPTAYWVDDYNLNLTPCSIVLDCSTPAFRFMIEGTEVMTIERERVLVRGRECGQDSEVFEHVREFFKTLRY